MFFTWSISKRNMFLALYMIEICKDKKLETLYGILVRDNHRAIRLLEKMGVRNGVKLAP